MTVAALSERTDPFEDVLGGGRGSGPAPDEFGCRTDEQRGRVLWGDTGAAEATARSLADMLCVRIAGGSCDQAARVLGFGAPRLAARYAASPPPHPRHRHAWRVFNALAAAVYSPYLAHARARVQEISAAVGIPDDAAYLSTAVSETVLREGREPARAAMFAGTLTVPQVRADAAQLWPPIFKTSVGGFIAVSREQEACAALGVSTTGGYDAWPEMVGHWLSTRESGGDEHRAREELYERLSARLALGDAN